MTARRRPRGGRWIDLFARAAFALAAATAMPFAAADAPAPLAWKTINAKGGYTAEALGDPRGEGTRVVVRASASPEGDFGGTGTAVDAAPLRGSRVVVEATLEPSAEANNVTIWLRADDANAKPIGFATSAPQPVPPGTSARREIGLWVPQAATHVVFGVVLPGKGSVVADRLRLRVDADAKPAGGVTARATIDAAIAIVRDKALKADAIDWPAASARYRAMAGDSDPAPVAYAAIRALLAELRDGHSFLMERADAEDHDGAGRAIESPVVRLEAGGIGYVRVPAYTGGNPADVTAFAQTMAAEIDAISAQATRGWIVDLRGNGGGNMWPMLAGLRALLGDGEIGGFRDRDGKVERWRAGDLVDGVKAHADLSNARVAVLLGPKTASSGEAVAVAFHGRPNARAFGRATHGQANANSMHKLPDGSRLLLSTAIDLDRHGTAFGGKVEPDEVVDGEAETLAAATAWLTSPAP
ncbi:S41 family peptidase [Tahibacter soli]|uniref:S41 family peptidase n=1 Tax=Tahibacter soli TaxID=2983605 RepID=A0A9X3YGU3_9GAMM|nr:S41 family peptidase [Tahibacter soli]MDC8011434.1 S41 family peptidase [Tahibacter soli]